MRIAIFSDIHGNKEALASIIEDIKKENIDETICLGDTIGIGPNPKESLDLIIENKIKTVIGNHELYFLKGTDIDDEMGEGQIKHQKWVREQIEDYQREYLEKSSMTIEKEYNGKTVLFEHFPIDYDTNEQYPFYDIKVVKDGSIEEIAKSINKDLIFIGHEHNEFTLDEKLYDVGSSGCRKDNKTRYTILDTNTFNIETKIIEYDRTSFEKSFKENDYPDRDKIANWFFGIEL